MTGSPRTRKHLRTLRHHLATNSTTKTNAKRVRKAIRRVTKLNDVVTQPFAKTGMKSIAQTRNARVVRVLFRKLGCLSQTHDHRNGFRTRANAALMTRAVMQRVELDALFDVKRTDSLRTVEFVSGDRQKINAKLPHARFDFPARLSGVRMYQDPTLSSYCEISGIS